MTDPAFHDNAARGRLELDVAGEIVFADYERRADALVIRHVYAPPPLRGTGAADRLMGEIANLARGEDRKIVAICSYANAWLRGHAAHRDLLAR